MMVEAEATDNVIELIAGGAGAPTESVVAEGLEAAKPFIAALCTAQEELAAAAGKETGDYPVFPTTRTTCSTPSPRWPPTSSPRR